MPIKIITDSTCDLPESEARQNGITVVPCYINIGEKSYLDGIDLSRKEFYQRLPVYPVLPKTSSPNQSAFEKAYEAAAAEGATQVLSIHVAGAFSSVVDTACLAAQAVRSVQVTVFDSESVSLGLGFLALTAARTAAAGKSVAEILALLKAKVERTILYAGLDTADYLRRSGRATRIQASLSAFLHIFPVLHVYRGVVDMERIRTHARVFERLVSLTEEASPMEDLAVLHTNCVEQAEEICCKIQHLLPGRRIWIREATPAIGTHVGPNALGIVCLRA